MLCKNNGYSYQNARAKNNGVRNSCLNGIWNSKQWLIEEWLISPAIIKEWLIRKSNYKWPMAQGVVAARRLEKVRLNFFPGASKNFLYVSACPTVYCRAWKMPSGSQTVCHGAVATAACSGTSSRSTVDSS